MIRRFLKYFKPHRTLFFIDLFCAFLVGLSDEFLPLFVRQIINEAVPAKDLRMITQIGIAMIIIYVVKLLLNMVINYWGHVFGVRVQADMRKDIFTHIEQLPIRWFDDHKTGEIMSRITNDLQEISEMAHHGPENLFICSVMLVVSGILLFQINSKLTWIVYLALPLAILFVVLVRKGQMEAFARTRKEIGAINGETENSIAGIRVSRASNALEEELAKFSDANVRYVGARQKAYMYLALFNGGINFFTDLMYAIVILFGGRMLFSGEINAGDFTAYLLFISMFLSPIRRFVETYEMIADGLSGYRRFEEIMNLPLEADEEGAEDAGVLRGEIEFRDVSFRYTNNEEEGPMVISHLNLLIKEKEKLGLAGPSGGGKTTLCSLLPRFYEIDEGAILIDGMDIRQMTRASLRRNIAMVSQDVFLFHGTIKENIAYGNPEAKDEEIIHAAKLAEIHEDIMQMPHGYDTEVGERGVHLSGGQRQRISIARAFLRNPQILILDEATSALDNVTEHLVQKSLDELSKGRTVITVAHRLSTIEHCDNIAVLTRNGIEESGTLKELLDRRGIYWQMAEGSLSKPPADLI